MKKDLAATKKDKKTKKAAEKIEKQELKAEKKKLRQEKEKQKEKLKEDKKNAKSQKKAAKAKADKKKKGDTKKKGRTSKEKAEDWKKMSSKEKAQSEEEAMVEKAAGEKDECEKQEPEKTPDVVLEPASKEDGIDVHPDEMPDVPFEESVVPLDGKETFPVKSPKMQRIKRIASKSKIDVTEDPESGKKKGKGETEEVTEDTKKRKGKGQKKGDTEKEPEVQKKKKKAEKTDEKVETKTSKGKKKAETSEKKGEKVSKRQPQKAPAGEPKPKRSRKITVEDEPVEISQLTKGMVLEVLKECKSSNCTHPSFVMPQPGSGIYIMPYWSRNHAGVLVPRHFVKNPRKPSNATAKSKTRKDRGSQVAYFSNDAPCAYSNLLLAGVYVSCRCWGGIFSGFHIPRACVII